MNDYQSLTGNELEQAKHIAAAHWEGAVTEATTICLMPEPSTERWSGSDGESKITADIIFMDKYSFAYFPQVDRLFIGKKENHNIIPDFEHTQGKG